MAKAEQKPINPCIFGIICAVLAFALYNSLATLSLCIWGSTVTGTLTGYSSTLADGPKAVGRSRLATKYYSFKAGGREYHSWTRYYTDAAWPDLPEGESRPEQISYLPVFPRINKPAHLTSLSSQGPAALVYHLIAIPGSLFLFWLVLRQQIKLKKSSRLAEAAGLQAPP